MTIVRDGTPATIAASAPLARALDEVQYRHGSGPCLQAATTGRPVGVADPAADDRWGPVAPTMGERGVRSPLSFPLPAQRAVSGGLNLYAHGTEANDGRTLALLGRFAVYAVVPVSHTCLYRSAVERAAHLAAAPGPPGGHRPGQGHPDGAAQADRGPGLQALARVSMARNQKVREVAERFVHTGQLPDG